MLNGWLIEVEPGLYVPDPVMVYMQLSSSLSVLELIWLGYELTSAFALEGCYTGKRIDSLPLFDLEQAARAMRRGWGVGNMRKALRALSYVKPHAASPPEIEMSMKLGLPFHYGGEGLSCHEINAVMDIGEEARLFLGVDYCKGDIFFRKSSLDLEYQSNEWHSGADNRIKDDRRRIILEAEGYEVKFVAAWQLSRPEEMHKLARFVYGRLRKRYRVKAADHAARQQELYQLFQTSLLVPMTRCLS